MSKKEERLEPFKGFVLFGSKEDLDKIAKEIIKKCKKFIENDTGN